jgi:hypothetical protein
LDRLKTEIFLRKGLDRKSLICPSEAKTLRGSLERFMRFSQTLVDLQIAAIGREKSEADRRRIAYLFDCPRASRASWRQVSNST